jgi:hypothetical protein
VRALRRLIARMEVATFAPDRIEPVFDEIERWAPRMYFADACAVVLARSYDQAFVLTTVPGLLRVPRPLRFSRRAFHI